MAGRTVFVFAVFSVEGADGRNAGITSGIAGNHSVLIGLGAAHERSVPFHRAGRRERSKVKVRAALRMPDETSRNIGVRFNHGKPEGACLYKTLR